MIGLTGANQHRIVCMGDEHLNTSTLHSHTSQRSHLNPHLTLSSSYPSCAHLSIPYFFHRSKNDLSAKIHSLFPVQSFLTMLV
jgi:hypothetical protein